MADRIDLQAYPMPPGAPRLMPFQDQPFNGDGYLAAEILRLKEAHGLTAAVETGTCYGSTSIWLWDHFQHTDTIEIHRPNFDVAVERVVKLCNKVMEDDIGTSDVWAWNKARQTIHLWHGDSVDMLQRYFGDNLRNLYEVKGERFLLFLDAHWGDVCPLLREIEAISDKGIRPVIVIHDFFVPGRPDLGYDCFPDGRPFKLENVSASLDRVYGPDGWEFHYNDRAEGAKRGVLFVTPRG